MVDIDSVIIFTCLVGVTSIYTVALIYCSSWLSYFNPERCSYRLNFFPQFNPGIICARSSYTFFCSVYFFICITKIAFVCLQNFGDCCWKLRMNWTTTSASMNCGDSIRRMYDWALFFGSPLLWAAICSSVSMTDEYLAIKADRVSTLELHLVGQSFGTVFFFAPLKIALVVVFIFIFLVIVVVIFIITITTLCS